MAVRDGIWYAESPKPQLKIVACGSIGEQLPNIAPEYVFAHASNLYANNLESRFPICLESAFN